MTPGLFSDDAALYHLLGRRYCHADGFSSQTRQNVFPRPHNYPSLFCARLSHDRKSTDMTHRTFRSHVVRAITQKPKKLLTIIEVVFV